MNDAKKYHQKLTIGIVGGLGPFAHIELEQRLLKAAREILNAKNDQSFPEWLLSSIPKTPDRTAAICGLGESPVPMLIQSLKRLETSYDKNGNIIPGADFAIIACNTSHKFLPELRNQIKIPIIDMIEETAVYIADKYPESRVGILATTGTLKSGIYHKSLKNNGLIPLSPLDLPDGETIQQSYVMEPIYGQWNGKEYDGKGIKSKGPTLENIDKLKQAAFSLDNFLNTDVFIAGCTEISLALSDSLMYGKPLIDPLYIVAETAVRLAYEL